MWSLCLKKKKSSFLLLQISFSLSLFDTSFPVLVFRCYNLCNINNYEVVGLCLCVCVRERERELGISGQTLTCTVKVHLGATVIAVGGTKQSTDTHTCIHNKRTPSDLSNLSIKHFEASTLSQLPPADG